MLSFTRTKMELPVREGCVVKGVDVDGLCTNCGKEGHNRLMLTRIPNFQEVIIVSFECTSR